MATVNLTHSVPTFTPPTPFVNEPFVDFSLPENKRRMQAALADVQSKLGREYDIVIGGKRLKTDRQNLLHEPGASGGGDRRPSARGSGARRTGDAGRAGGFRDLEPYLGCGARRACCFAPRR